MSKNTKINFLAISSQFSDLVYKMDKISDISSTIRIKIDKEETLIYSLVGETAILVFKNFIVKTKDYFIFPEDFNYTIDFTITKSKALLKQLKLFKEVDIKISLNTKMFDADIDETVVGRVMKLTDNRIKVSQIGAESDTIRDISIEKLKTILDSSHVNWEYNMNIDDLSDIIKLSEVDNVSKIVNIEIRNKQIFFNEDNSWELLIGDIDEADTDITFGKKYLKSINAKDSENINFKIFGNFILFSDSISNLLVAVDQTFDDDDE